MWGDISTKVYLNLLKFSIAVCNAELYCLENHSVLALLPVLMSWSFIQ